MAMEEVVHVDGLVKKYGRLTAVDDISFAVYRGETFGIVGPNGAGKTTTLEIIEGLQPATKGRIRVLGMDISTATADTKELIGVQLQSSAYYDYLTLTEILALFGSFYKTRIPPKDLLDLVALQDKANTRVKNLSGGQKQRFMVATSLINNPGLVILDEPTAGLDPTARRSLWKLIRQISSRGTTIILTTHYMEEAHSLCERVAIMDRGKIVALDTVQSLIRSLSNAYYVALTTSKSLQLSQAESDLWNATRKDESSLELRVQDPPQVLPILLKLAADQGVTIQHLEVVPASLEDVFMALTGRHLDQ